MQQRWIQQLHHVFNFSIQLQHITLGKYIGQHRQEVISSIQPPWVEGNTVTDKPHPYTSSSAQKEKIIVLREGSRMLALL